MFEARPHRHALLVNLSHSFTGAAIALLGASCLVGTTDDSRNAWVETRSQAETSSRLVSDQFSSSERSDDQFEKNTTAQATTKNSRMYAQGFQPFTQ